MRFRLRLSSLFVIVLSLVVAASSQATLFVRVSDQVLIDQADLRVEVEFLDEGVASEDGAFTLYRARVVRQIGGESEGDEVTIRVPGAIVSQGMSHLIHGAPAFSQGEQAFLLLRATESGMFQPLHLAQGVFRLAEHDGGLFAWRSASGATEVALGKSSDEVERARDYSAFLEYVAERSQGQQIAATYWRPEVSIHRLTESWPYKFNFIESNGLALRWRQFDSGGRVTFLADAKGQPGMSGGGYAEFQQALQAWNSDPATPIDLRYAGQTNATGGLTDFDGINAILFDDPNDNSSFESEFSCSSGGIIAIASPWFDPNVRHTFDGRTFITIQGGDIITNKGIDCYIPFNRRAPEVFAHELGHTLGLSHSCGGDDGPCNTFQKNDALMRSQAHGDGRGARLGQDDREGIAVLYSMTVTQVPPTAPSNLAASATASGIQLSWIDRSDNEATFRVERAFTAASSPFIEIATLGANSQAYTDTTVSTGTGYAYRVRAVNAAGASPFAGPVQVVSLGETAPQNAQASALSSTQIRVEWDDVSSTESSFEVEVRAPAFGGSFSLAATVGANVESAVVSGLLPGVRYEARVRAVGPSGASGYSNTASATTFAGEPEPCIESSTRACVNGERFKIEVTWRDFSGGTGSGRVVPVPNAVEPDDSTLFYFFGANNWELLVKVLDGCPVNDRFWVFAAATTDVEYTLVVTDSQTGATSVYFNPLGVAAPAVADVEAFSTCSASAAEAGSPLSLTKASGDRGLGTRTTIHRTDALPTSPAAAALAATAGEGAALNQALKEGACVETDETLCLRADRFAVSIDWRDFSDNTGSGQVVPVSSNDSGLFYFFNPNNWEVLIKVLNGCPLNDHYWVFSAATTNVEYGLTVTDTMTGVSRRYSNPLGRLAPAITDTEALPVCP